MSALLRTRCPAGRIGYWGLRLLRPGRGGEWCREVDVEGTGGPDILFSVSSRPAVERGRAGRGVLITGGGNDVLDGGPGTDQGDAGKGKDTCISIEKPRFPPRLRSRALRLPSPGVSCDRGARTSGGAGGTSAG